MFHLGIFRKDCCFTIAFRLSGKRHAFYTLKRDVNRTKVDGRTNDVCPTTYFIQFIDSRKAQQSLRKHPSFTSKKMRASDVLPSTLIFLDGD